MSTSEKDREAALCTAKVRVPMGFRSAYKPCGRKATSADGRFCGIHDPAKKAERAEKRGPSAWEREVAARKARDAAIRAEGYRAGLERAEGVIRENMEALWPEGVSFVQDTKRHAAINAMAWVRALAGEDA